MKFTEDAAFGQRAICGIDEAGRGCLAGPVVAASVTWNPREAETQPWFPLVDDSKRVREMVREQLFSEICRRYRVRVAVVSNFAIDVMNILRASLHAFELVAPDQRSDTAVVIDGTMKPPSLDHATTLIKGDSKVSAVAAASIVAKVFRDQLMRGLDDDDVYGFSAHKGYATMAHRNAITRHGISSHHRKSFAPIRERCPEPNPNDGFLIQQLEISPQAELGVLWKQFTKSYCLYSYGASMRALALFQRRGLAITPSPHAWKPDFESSTRPGQGRV